jgi:hypothetical protein
MPRSVPRSPFAPPRAFALAAGAALFTLAGCATNNPASNASAPTAQPAPLATPAATPAAPPAPPAAAAPPGPRRANPSLNAELRARERREVDTFKARKNLEELQTPTTPPWFTSGVTTEGNDLIIPATGRAAKLPAAYDAAFDAASAAAVQIPRAALPDATPTRAAFAALPSGGFRVWLLTRTRNPNLNAPPPPPTAAPLPPPQPIEPPPPIDLPK